MYNGEKKVSRIFKIIDYNRNQKDENFCVQEALDALDLYLAESKKEL